MYICVCILCTGRECTEGDVRLAKGHRSAYDGSVEVCLDGMWITVCNAAWDINDATVVCRQLGYDGGQCLLEKHLLYVYSSPSHSILLSSESYAIHDYSVVNNVRLPFHVDNVSCSGSERNLSECGHNKISAQNCSRDVAAVICTGGDRIEKTYTIIQLKCKECVLCFHRLHL